MIRKLAAVAVAPIAAVALATPAHADTADAPVGASPETYAQVNYFTSRAQVTALFGTKGHTFYETRLADGHRIQWRTYPTTVSDHDCAYVGFYQASLTKPHLFLALHKQWFTFPADGPVPLGC